MLENHHPDNLLDKFAEENDLWSNSIFETCGSGSGSKQGSEMKQTSNYNSSSNTPTTEMTKPVAAAAEAQVGNKRKRNGKATACDGGEGGGGESEHEMHILTERERRKKMRNMFSILHSLVPQLPEKADKSTIVEEAVGYIKSLQNTLQTLEQKRLEKLQGAATIVDYDHSVIASPVVQSRDSREAFLADQVLSPKANLSMMSSSSNMMNYPNSASFQLPNASAGFQTWFSPNVAVNMSGNDAQISVYSPKKPGVFATLSYILEKHNLDVVSAHISSNGYRSIYMIHAQAGERASGSHQFPGALTVEETFKLAVGEMNLWLLTC